MFKGAMEESIEHDALLNEKKITMDSFVLDVKALGGIENAILVLDDDHLQFYSDNERAIDKLLRKYHLDESYNNIDDIDYLGWSKTSELKFKTIKYKGYLITLEWDPELATWQPTVRMRSVTNALRYGKELVDARIASKKAK
jgi:hypothetical protein